jgi:hypothetical protein
MTLSRTVSNFFGLSRGGPTRIRTWNQGIRVFRRFPSGADYLFTLRLWRMGCGTLEPVIKGAEALR